MFRRWEVVLFVAVLVLNVAFGAYWLVEGDAGWWLNLGAAFFMLLTAAASVYGP